MLLNVLAWSALGLALFFAVLSLVVMFAGGLLGASALTIVAPIAVGAIAISILLSAAMLVVSLVQ